MENNNNLPLPLGSRPCHILGCCQGRVSLISPSTSPPKPAPPAQPLTMPPSNFLPNPQHIPNLKISLASLLETQSPFLASMRCLLPGSRNCGHRTVKSCMPVTSKHLMLPSGVSGVRFLLRSWIPWETEIEHPMLIHSCRLKAQIRSFKSWLLPGRHFYRAL